MELPLCTMLGLWLGLSSTAGFDVSRTFNPVVKPTTIPIILCIALSKGWIVEQLNIDNEFLNGDLKEEVFMDKPIGFEISQTPVLVCKLHTKTSSKGLV